MSHSNATAVLDHKSQTFEIPRGPEQDDRGFLEEDAKESSQFRHRLSYIFRRLDRNGDGLVNRRDLVKTLRQAPEVASFFLLPEVIRQEDGSRDLMEGVFQKVDRDNSKDITWAEFQNHFGPEVDQAPRKRRMSRAHQRESQQLPFGNRRGQSQAHTSCESQQAASQVRLKDSPFSSQSSRTTVVANDQAPASCPEAACALQTLALPAAGTFTAPSQPEPWFALPARRSPSIEPAPRLAPQAHPLPQRSPPCAVAPQREAHQPLQRALGPQDAPRRDVGPSASADAGAGAGVGGKAAGSPGNVVVYMPNQELVRLANEMQRSRLEIEELCSVMSRACARQEQLEREFEETLAASRGANSKDKAQAGAMMQEGAAAHSLAGCLAKGQR